MEVSGQLHAAAILPLVPIAQEAHLAGWYLTAGSVHVLRVSFTYAAAKCVFKH